METSELKQIITSKTGLKYKYTTEKLKGASITSPTGDMFKNVISLDFKSYYISILIANKLFTQELRDYLRHQLYLKDLGNPDAKFVVNRIYGLLKHYDLEQTKLITAFGRDYIKQLRAFLISVGYNVIYSHTDSVFVSDINSEDSKVCLVERVRNYIRSYINSRLRIDIEHEFMFIYFRHNGAEYVKNRYLGIKQDNSMYFNGFKPTQTEIAFIALIKKKLENGEGDVTIKELQDFIKKYIPKEITTQSFINLYDLGILRVKRDYVKL